MTHSLVGVVNSDNMFSSIQLVMATDVRLILDRLDPLLGATGTIHGSNDVDKFVL